MATYICIVAVSAAVLVAATAGTFPPDHWIDLIIFLAAAVTSERWAVASSLEGSMSLSLTVGFAAAILYGPAFAGIIAIGGVVISDLIISHRHWTRVVFNAGQLTLSAGFAALVYRLLAVPGPVDLSRDALAILVAAVVFLLVNDTLVTVVISLSGRSFFHEWTASFREMGVLYVSMAPLGALLAFAYQDSRWNILYFPFLILVIYNGFKLYANLQTETDNALVLLADTVDKRDEYTFQHSRRVAEYAGEIARALDLPRKEIDLVISAARVHDLGKIATDNRILYKQASLTDDERKAIIAHPADGSELAGQFSMYRKGLRLHTPPPRTLGRPRLPRRPGRHAHPARRAHHHRGRRLRRHDLRPARTARRCRPRSPSPSCAAAPAGSSTPISSTRSSASIAATRSRTWSSFPPSIARTPC